MPAPMEVFGYTDRLSAAPGEQVSVMVSSAGGPFEARLVRLIHGDVHPDGPGYRAEPVPSSFEGSHPGAVQPLRLGSHLAVAGLELPPRLGCAVWAWPTTLGPAARGLIGQAEADGLAVVLDHEGHVVVRLGGEEVARSQASLALRVWQLVVVGCDVEAGEISVGVSRAGGKLGLERLPFAASASSLATAGAELRVGAGAGAEHFNGKLEAPIIFERPLSEDECRRLFAGAVAPEEVAPVLAHWDFGARIGSRAVADASGHGHDGRLVNLPTSAVTGRLFDGSEVDFRRVPEQYAALHFHDDDLDDAGWEPNFSWVVPEDLASGIYGIELRCGEAEDVIPVFVRPPRGTATAPVALLVPTFSYLAYGNEHCASAPGALKFFEDTGCAIEYPVAPQDVTILAERLHSLYDHHSDGAGVCYSSWLRPLLSMRPKYNEPDLSLGQGAAHQLNADLHLVDWLHQRGQEFDVITDVDLHNEGPELLENYRVVLTGSHPEYVSERILDAIAAYLGDGGRMMYLGGNGFYWVTELDPEEGHTVEVRRWGASTRMWDARAGEWHLSTTGTLGGTWRFRDRAPQRLFGTGFSAQGSGRNRPYQRSPESYGKRLAFVFEGLGEREEVGAQPALVNFWGAAGFEIDRFDAELGSPEGTVVLATATGFSDHYQHVIDEVLLSDSLQGGTVNPLVRADMVFVPYPRGGAVFSPGSIAWCSCLSYDDYRSDVSRITGNVLERFLETGDAL